MKKSMILVWIIEVVLGLFIGATAVYAIISKDVYYGGACLLSTITAIMILLGSMYVNSITKD